MLRILHFSDIHLRAPYASVPVADLVPKRALGLVNLALRREAHFRDAVAKVAGLRALTHDENVDLVLCTGDYTALGTNEELRIARDAIEPLVHQRLGFVTVPGNHDVYVDSAVTERRFENHFGEFLGSDLPEYAVDGPWPLVRFLNDDLAVVAVNSARPNSPIFRSSGVVPQLQLDTLVRLLRDPRLQSRRVVIATHYALRRQDGKPDHPWHGLVNVDDFIEAVNTHPRACVVHGHIHWRYTQLVPGLKARVFGAGSATYKGREGLWQYEFAREAAVAVPGTWDGTRFVLDRARTTRIF